MNGQALGAVGSRIPGLLQRWNRSWVSGPPQRVLDSNPSWVSVFSLTKKRAFLGPKRSQNLVVFGAKRSQTTPNRPKTVRNDPCFWPVINGFCAKPRHTRRRPLSQPLNDGVFGRGVAIAARARSARASATLWHWRWCARAREWAKKAVAGDCLSHGSVKRKKTLTPALSQRERGQARKAKDPRTPSLALPHALTESLWGRETEPESGIPVRPLRVFFAGVAFLRGEQKDQRREEGGFECLGSQAIGRRLATKRR